MSQVRALMLALATAVIAGCATSGNVGQADPETGIRPQDNAATREASLLIVQADAGGEPQARQTRYQQAMDAALLAIQQMPENPKAYLLAGQAALGLHDWVRADTMFERAVELYPRYQEDIVEGERDKGWVAAYRLGAAAVEAGDIEAAEAMFEGADLLSDVLPDARLSLGQIYANRGDTEAAADAYMSALEILSREPPEAFSDEDAQSWRANRLAVTFQTAQLLTEIGDFERGVDLLQSYLDEHGAEMSPEAQLRVRTALAGFLAQSGDAAAAEAMYNEIMERSDLGFNEYFQAGVGFFNTGDFARAAEAFSNAAEKNPYSRDALLNVVQALYSQSAQASRSETETLTDQEQLAISNQILDAAQRVRELDPLNRNLISFMLRAYRTQLDLMPASEQARIRGQMQELSRQYEVQDFELLDIRVGMETRTRARITGSIANIQGDVGDSVTLRFELVNVQGRAIGDTRVTVQLAAPGEAVEFTDTVDIPEGGFAGWRYEVVD